ncbi:hypothetical protein AAE478_005976 [Parahypoxylon ruwenzoriense]
MTAIAKTVVATGVSSGLVYLTTQGFELVKQRLIQAQPYKIILGARNTYTALKAYDDLLYHRSKHNVTIFPLELSNPITVKTFAQQTLEKLGSDKIDYLFLNAARITATNTPSPYSSKWSQVYLINHLSQHYLIHLLREKLEASRTRIVFTGSGVLRRVTDPDKLKDDVLRTLKTETTFSKNAKTIDFHTGTNAYRSSKFIQLLSAHWWRRRLQDKCEVLAVSPGLVPDTGLHRENPSRFTMIHQNPNSIPQGARNIFRAFTEDCPPDDPHKIFLMDTGEWWPKHTYRLTLNEYLQNKWCPGKDRIEEECGITAYDRFKDSQLLSFKGDGMNG